jgi:hypothetical protein
MARYRKKKALYEVMSKGRLKPCSGEKLERLHPQESKKVESVSPSGNTEAPEGSALWWKRPKLIQLNAGRIEISLPYQYAIAVLLVLILLVLMAFRLGQLDQRISDSTRQVPNNNQRNPARLTAPNTEQNFASIERLSPTVEKAEPAEPTGNNRIVIQTHQVKTHLVPVKRYFDRLGVETEIKQLGNWYYLVTKDTYTNPEIKGSEGYLAKQKIIELGAQYKAPPGYEPFGAKSFASAYGMRFDD